jgi:putative two-component system response regulator
MLTEAMRFAKVVVIDDVAANLRLLESSLRALGLSQVKAFSDSAAGLAWLQQNPWDLLLLDLDMPQPDGFEILRQLSERDRSRSTVIVVTALSDADNRRRGLAMGANDYISKPLDLPELLMRVHSCLQLSRASQLLNQERASLEQKVQQRTEQLSASFQSLVRSLSRAAEYKDDETGSHIMRIGASAALIASALGQDPEWVELLRLAAPMHDVGKIGIPDYVLLKPGAFTAEERAIMNRHAQIGFDILHDEAHSPLLELAAEVALYHHEKWDGSGYPAGLKGEAIPLAARIVALCDVYDALRSTRPYKQAWSAERAQQLIRTEAGRHFDPQLVQVIEGLFEQIEDLQNRFSDSAA